MIDMTEPYVTIHSFHVEYLKPIDECMECDKLLAEHKQKLTDAKIDQAIEDKYHNHGKRK